MGSPFSLFLPSLIRAKGLSLDGLRIFLIIWKSEAISVPVSWKTEPWIATEWDERTRKEQCAAQHSTKQAAKKWPREKPLIPSVVILISHVVHIGNLLFCALAFPISYAREEKFEWAGSCFQGFAKKNPPVQTPAGNCVLNTISFILQKARSAQQTAQASLT